MLLAQRSPPPGVRGLTFYRPSKQTEYVHVDGLFGEAGKNVIDWDLSESQFRHLMRRPSPSAGVSLHGDAAEAVA